MVTAGGCRSTCDLRLTTAAGAVHTLRKRIAQVSSQPARVPPKWPNVLWICTDQQRFDTLGCFGNDFVNTPNLDRLVHNGVLFSNFYTQSLVYAPSRASFLTGRYPRTTRLRQNGTAIPEDEVPVTGLLADEGYVCGVGNLDLGWDFSHSGGLSVTERRIDASVMFRDPDPLAFLTMVRSDRYKMSPCTGTRPGNSTTWPRIPARPTTDGTTPPSGMSGSRC